MIKYKASRWDWGRGPITIIKVDRETTKCIWIGGVKTNKSSDTTWYRDTFKEAKQCLIDYRLKEVSKTEQNIKSYQKQLQEYKIEVTKAINLKERDVLID